MEDEESNIPSDEQRAKERKLIHNLKIGNRFRLMLGMPLLQQEGLKFKCCDCHFEYESTNNKCPQCNNKEYYT